MLNSRHVVINTVAAGEWSLQRARDVISNYCENGMAEASLLADLAAGAMHEDILQVR